MIFHECSGNCVLPYRPRRNLVPRSPKGEPGLIIHHPLVVPTPRLPSLVGRLNAALLSGGLRRLAVTYDIRSPVIWTRVPTALVWSSIQQFRDTVLVYQSVDKFPDSPMIPEEIRPRLRQSENLFC